MRLHPLQARLDLHARDRNSGRIDDRDWHVDAASGLDDPHRRRAHADVDVGRVHHARQPTRPRLAVHIGHRGLGDVAHRPRDGRHIDGQVDGGTPVAVEAGITLGDDAFEPAAFDRLGPEAKAREPRRPHGNPGAGHHVLDVAAGERAAVVIARIEVDANLVADLPPRLALRSHAKRRHSVRVDAESAARDALRLGILHDDRPRPGRRRLGNVNREITGSVGVEHQLGAMRPLPAGIEHGDVDLRPGPRCQRRRDHFEVYALTGPIDPALGVQRRVETDGPRRCAGLVELPWIRQRAVSHRGQADLVAVCDDHEDRRADLSAGKSARQRDRANAVAVGGSLGDRLPRSIEDADSRAGHRRSVDDAGDPSEDTTAVNFDRRSERRDLHRRAGDEPGRRLRSASGRPHLDAGKARIERDLAAEIFVDRPIERERHRRAGRGDGRARRRSRRELRRHRRIHDRPYASPRRPHIDRVHGQSCSPRFEGHQMSRRAQLRRPVSGADRSRRDAIGPVAIDVGQSGGHGDAVARTRGESKVDPHRLAPPVYIRTQRCRLDAQRLGEDRPPHSVRQVETHANAMWHAFGRLVPLDGDAHHDQRRGHLERQHMHARHVVVPGRDGQVDPRAGDRSFAEPNADDVASVDGAVPDGAEILRSPHVERDGAALRVASPEQRPHRARFHRLIE